MRTRTGRGGWRKEEEKMDGRKRKVERRNKKEEEEDFQAGAAVKKVDSVALSLR